MSGSEEVDEAIKTEAQAGDEHQSRASDSCHHLHDRDARPHPRKPVSHDLRGYRDGFIPGVYDDDDDDDFDGMLDAGTVDENDGEAKSAPVAWLALVKRD